MTDFKPPPQMYQSEFHARLHPLSLTRLAAAIFAINCTSAQVSAHLDISLETVQMGFVAHLTPYDGLIATTSVQSLVSNLL